MQVYLQFWAKTYRGIDPNQGPVAFKPVVHHLLDVAAVGLSYLRCQQARLDREVALLGMPGGNYADLLAFLAGLHDLGKFTRNFQAKVGALWPPALGARPGAALAGPTHWRATGLMLQLDPFRSTLATLLPDLRTGSANLLPSISGHHGRPPPHDDDDKVARDALRRGQWLDPVCMDAAHFAFQELRRLTGVQRVPGINADNAPLLSWRLGGLITLADWIGSDAEYFPPLSLETPLDDYWHNAQKAAERAIIEKGLAPLRPAVSPNLARIAPRAAVSPRPMQRLAGELLLGAGPQLFLIEDATGSGKTEGALLLAARLMEAGLGEGVYFALPTMATANAMHRRLEVAAALLFADDSEARPPSVILSHGKAQIAGALKRLEAQSSGEEYGSAAAACNAWLADDRRRAFFADVGAGTIDQAFLAVLPKKHLTLRQYALAGRILIVDEAHCFDAYMKEELNALLRLHAMNGGSAIVLSATLAQKIRRQIVRGYYEGLGLTKMQAVERAARCVSPAYPLLTHVTRDSSVECATSLDPRLARAVFVERLDSRDCALREAAAAADKGAAVLIICNAVDAAIAVHEALTTVHQRKPILFHARFVQGDRIAIEDAVLARFGQESAPDQRAGHILVATQVVEQSLDLDFDLIVSDLAPIDLLIQRAGRLWRHMGIRPAASRALAEPRLLIVSPDPAAACTSDWLVQSLGQAAFVYQDAGVMWRTARTIFARGALNTPEDLRPMIEAVYGVHKEAVPAGLEAAEVRGEGREGKARTLGAFNVIDLSAGYGALPPNLRADEDIGTRLGEPTLTIRLGRRENGLLVPLFRAGGDLQLDWALSEIRVRTAFWGRASPVTEDAPLQVMAKASWTEWESGIPIAEVDDTGQLRVQPGRFGYSVSSGLRRYVD